MMTEREAKRIALASIVASVEADAPWHHHSETHALLSQDEYAKVMKAGEEILTALRRRAKRLRSLHIGR